VLWSSRWKSSSDLSNWTFKASSVRWKQCGICGCLYLLWDGEWLESL
jgi:hypothetical protein